jgi:hypothetical protein
VFTRVVNHWVIVSGTKAKTLAGICPSRESLESVRPGC